MSTNIVYRGTSLSQANQEEFSNGRVEGYTANIYHGMLDTDDPHSTVARGTPLLELPWWDDGGTVPEEDLLWHDTQGVVGGFSGNIGTSLGFASGIPILLYFDTSKMTHSPTRVGYSYDWFDSFEGALSWVYGPSVDGEVHDMEEGLIGLTVETDSGPQVWKWGDDLERASMQYEDEGELLAFTDSVDIDRSVISTATVLESQRNPKQALGTFEKYATTRFETAEVDVTDWSPERTVRTLYDEILERANRPLENHWIIVLNSMVMEGIHRIPDNIFEFAYNGSETIYSPDDLPSHLLGQ